MSIIVAINEIIVIIFFWRQSFKKSLRFLTVNTILKVVQTGVHCARYQIVEVGHFGQAYIVET